MAFCRSPASILWSFALASNLNGSNTTIEGDTKVIQVDYSNDESIKHALTGVDIVISTISMAVLNIQGKIAAAANESDVKVVCSFSIRNKPRRGIRGNKGVNTWGKGKYSRPAESFWYPIQYTGFYTGIFAGYLWKSYISR